MSVLHVLSAGAAKAIVLALADSSGLTEHVRVAARFDAAGTIRGELLRGDPCDVVILPASMLAELAADGRVHADSVASLGSVPTGIAVPAGEPHPPIGDRGELRASLARASSLFCPDTERATAGIHFLRVLRALDLYDAVASRVRGYPNGATAMAAMAADAAAHRGALGCTQVTEILYTQGVEVVGHLPAPFELTTVYAAAVATGVANERPGRAFIARLTGNDMRASRAASGFIVSST